MLINKTNQLNKDSKIFKLDTKPEELELKLSETALIVVDMQNAYASKGGYLDLAGFDISGAKKVVQKISQALAMSRKAKMKVFFFQNGWDKNYVEAGGPGSPNWYKSNALKTMKKNPELQGKLLSRGGWDYELIEEFKPGPEEVLIAKPRYSGFFNTQFDSLLRSHGIRNLIFCGIATNVCVESTMRDGFFLEYFSVMLEDATHQAGPDFIQQATIYNIQNFFGWTCNTDEFCHGLKAL